jgi:hypothetical protein
MAKFIKETYKKENGELVKYPLGADIKNVVITKVDKNGNEIIKNTLDKELEIVKQDSSSAAYPSYSIENIEEEGLEKLTKGESISSSIRKLYKVTSRFINHLKNITSGENHIPTGGKEGDILLWDSDGQAKWGPDENTTYSNFQGATANDPGKAGLVLAPAAGEQNKFLKGDGTWGSPDNAQYTPGIGISILNNQIGLATATITNTNGTDTSGTEMTIPYLTFDEYGRVKNIGTKKHTLPNSTFVGGTLTEPLYYGSDKNYSTNTSGISTLSKLLLKVNSGYTGIDLTSGTDNYNIGIEDNILQFKKDETTAYQIDTSGNNIFNTSVSVTGLKSTDGADRVVIAEAGTGKLKTSSSITATELGYLDGATSNIQTQLNTKVNKAEDTITGKLKFGSDSYYINNSGLANLNNISLDNNGSLFIKDSNGNLRTAVNLNASNIYNFATGNFSNRIFLGSKGNTTNVNIYGCTSISTSSWNTLNLHRESSSGNAAIRFSNTKTDADGNVVYENGAPVTQLLGYLAMNKIDGSFYRYTGDGKTNYTMVDSGNYSSVITTTKSNVTKPTSGTTYLLPFHANLSETGNTVIRCNNGIGCTLLEGTTSANGYSVLNLGNGISSGTSGNKYGVLKLFGTGANYVQLKANGAPSANRTISFPDVNGIVPIVTSASGKGSVSITLEASSFYLVSVDYGGNMYYNGYASTGTQSVKLTEISSQGGGNEGHISGYKITFTSSNSSNTVTVKYIKIR